VTDTDSRSHSTRPRLVQGLAWLAAAGVLAAAVRNGRVLQRATYWVYLGAAPLVGRNPDDGWTWRFGGSLLAAIGLAALLVWAVSSGWWFHLSSNVLIALTSIGAGAFAVLLALVDGRDGLLYGAVDKPEYYANLPKTPPAREFVDSFLERINDYSVHVRGHPPGYTLVLKFFKGLGFEGPWFVVMLSLAGTMVLPAAMLIAIRAFAGAGGSAGVAIPDSAGFAIPDSAGSAVRSDTSRRVLPSETHRDGLQRTASSKASPDMRHDVVARVAPLLMVSPFAIWMMTSADALYTAVGACAVAGCALGLHSTTRVRSLIWGLVAGVLFATLLFFTYGGATFAFVIAMPLALALHRRLPGAVPTLIGGVIGAAIVVGIWAALGFWWLAGAIDVKGQYWAGTAQYRPFGYFAYSNLAVTLFAIGPVTYAGFMRLRNLESTHLRPLIFGAAIALLVSHASQYSRGEVERIWLLFFPWLVLAGAAFVQRERPRIAGFAIALQAGCAIVLQAALLSKW
jgi:methylthioxylose transferase